MIFGTHLALDNSDHVLDGGPNPPTEGGFYKTYHVTFRSATSALAELLLKSVNAFQSYERISSGTFLWPTVYVTLAKIDIHLPNLW